MTERQLQDAVLDLAKMLGWHVVHFRPAQTQRGWRTPVEADGAGFPDLLLVRERLLCAELKVGANKLSTGQLRWQVWLERAGVECVVWRPPDLRDGTVERVLR